MLAPDKILHLKAGVLVAVVMAALGFALVQLGLHPIPIAVLVGGISASGSVEGTQWWDNRNAKAAGLPPPHEVSFYDFLASAAASVVASAAIEVASRLS